MVMVILEYFGAVIISRQYVDSVVKKKETRRVSSPIVFGIGEMFYSFHKYRLDIKVEYVEIKDCGYIGRGRDDNR